MKLTWSISCFESHFQFANYGWFPWWLGNDCFSSTWTVRINNGL